MANPLPGAGVKADDYGEESFADELTPWEDQGLQEEELEDGSKLPIAFDLASIPGPDSGHKGDAGADGLRRASRPRGSLNPQSNGACNVFPRVRSVVL